MILNIICLGLLLWYIGWWGYMYYVLKKEGLPNGDGNVGQAIQVFLTGLAILALVVLVVILVIKESTYQREDCRNKACQSYQLLP